MLIGPTLTLALNAAQTISDPQAKVGGPGSVAVQLQNASSFAIQVLTEGEQYFIQPFTAQTVPVSAQPVTITPMLQQGLSAATPLTPVWLLQGEGPPMQDGPLTAAALQAALNGLVTQPFDLFAQTAGIVAIPVLPGTATASGPALHQYACILVQLDDDPMGPIAVQVANVSKGITAEWQTVPADAIGTGTAFSNLYFPIPAAPGDNITVSATTLGASPTTGAILVYGLGFGLQPSPLRPDGRLTPLGSLGAYQTASSNVAFSYDLVPATPGVSTLIQSGLLWTNGPLPASAAIHWELFCTVGGTTFEFANAFATPLGLWVVGNPALPEAGILGDPNTAVSLTGVSDGTVSVAATITYDLVL